MTRNKLMGSYCYIIAGIGANNSAGMKYLKTAAKSNPKNLLFRLIRWGTERIRG